MLRSFLGARVVRERRTALCAVDARAEARRRRESSKGVLRTREAFREGRREVVLKICGCGGSVGGMVVVVGPWVELR